jgi:hypothetical protein
MKKIGKGGKRLPQYSSYPGKNIIKIRPQTKTIWQKQIGWLLLGHPIPINISTMFRPTGNTLTGNESSVRKTGMAPISFVEWQ